MQALLASEYAKGNYKKARIVLYRVLQIGGVTGAALSTTLLLGFGYLSMLFTDDAAVLDVAQTGVWVMTILRSQYLIYQVICNGFIVIG
jgi:Na+-driven multidrug efflux pump